MKLFFSYSHNDESTRDQLDVHFSMLKRLGEIDTWHDRRILGGEDFDKEIKFELEHADIILLLVSPNFLNSEYCYGVELKRALEKHAEGAAHVLPVIAEVCDWKHSPIHSLKAIPKDGKPLSKYANINDGLLEVVDEIRRIAEKRNGSKRPNMQVVATSNGNVCGPEIRTSNLRLKKEFSAADRDRFLFSSFDFMEKFFESSLKELEVRNKGIETMFRKINANVFNCFIYKNGSIASQCEISLGNSIGRSHQLTYSNQIRENSYNECLNVGDDGAVLFLKPTMGAFGLKKNVDGLTQEGASEYFWSFLIERLQ